MNQSKAKVTREQQRENGSFVRNARDIKSC